MNKNTQIFLLFLNLIVFSLIGNAQDMNFTWAKQFGSDNVSNDLQALASDNQDHVFAFTHYEHEFDIDGINYTSEGGLDLLLYSINEEGSVDWVLSDGGEDDQYAQKVACDDDGNVYIIGVFSNSMTLNDIEYHSNGAFDMFLAKYSNEGEYLWCQVFGGPNSESLISLEVKNNRVFVAGRFYDYTIIQGDTIRSFAGTDSFISRFNLEGDLLNYMTVGGESVDMVSDLAVDNNSNIYIAGDFYNNIHLSEDVTYEAGDYLGLYVAKYDNNFDLVWAYQPIGIDLKPGIKLDVSNDQRCVISGMFSADIHFGNTQFNTQPSDEDIFMASFTEDGSIDWVQRFFSNSMDNIIDVEMDQSGDVYIAGHYLGDIDFNGLILNYSLC